MALGARTAGIARMVLLEGLSATAGGLAVGLALALVLGGALRSMLYQVAPADPLTLAGVSLLLLGVALCACILPVLRATRVDPVVALRQE
jgi:ABC-type antimicrobial peptide transport system permease subunit